MGDEERVGGTPSEFEVRAMLGTLGLKNKYIHLVINTFVLQILEETDLTISKQSNNIKKTRQLQGMQKNKLLFLLGF